jgi:hypothetical protein
MGKIKCLVCGEILESKTRHDFQQCNCENESFVDGGTDYSRVGGVDLSKIEVIKDEISDNSFLRYRMLKTREVAEYFDVSPRVVRSWREKGLLPYWQIEKRYAIRYNKGHLDAFAKEQGIKVKEGMDEVFWPGVK